MLLLLFFSALLLASLSSFFLSTCPCVRSECPCSPRWSRGSLLLPGWFRGDVLGRMGRRRCRDATGRNKFYGGFCLRAPPSNHGHHLSTFKAYRPLYLPVVNLAPRWEGGMVGVRNERQTHLPTPPVWTAPLRSSLSSPSRGIIARVLWEESSFSGTLYSYRYTFINISRVLLTS